MPTPFPPELLERLAVASAPFHFEGDAVVLYRGLADEVRLLTWMPNFPAPPPFTALAADLHALRLALPATARIEYRLLVRRGRRLVESEDPSNPPDASNPFGSNSVLTGAAYRVPWFASGPPQGQGNSLEIRVQSTIFAGRRHHHVYLPKGVERKEAAALLLVHDGTDFMAHGGLGGALDMLVEQGVVPPLAAVLLEPRNRVAEYAAAADHSRHVVTEVIPHIARRLRVWAAPERVVALGSSLGAVASLALLSHHRQNIGAAISLSGSWAHRTDANWPSAVFAPIIEFLDGFDPSLLAGRRFYQSVGRYEGLLDFNRRLHPRLHAGGMNVRWVETWTGHDWAAWRDRLEDALTFVWGVRASPPGNSVRG